MRDARKLRGLPQETLAEAAQLSRNYISDMERGTRNPGLIALVRVARALKMPLRELLREIDVE